MFEAHRVDVMAGLKSDAWVQTLIPLMSLAGQVPSPWASACLSGKGRGGFLQRGSSQASERRHRGVGSCTSAASGTGILTQG